MHARNAQLFNEAISALPRPYAYRMTRIEKAHLPVPRRMLQKGCKNLRLPAPCSIGHGSAPFQGGRERSPLLSHGISQISTRSPRAHIIIDIVMTEIEAKMKRRKIICRPNWYRQLRQVDQMCEKWWAVQGSNLRPSPCQGDILPLN